MNKTNVDTCIVTGGSSGIGLSIVKRFLADGFNVYNIDIQPSEFGTFCHCDLTDHDAVIKTISTIANKQTINVLVSNAGMHYSANIENTSEHAFENVFNLNVKGAFAATKAVLPSMKAANNGAIIYIASDQAIIAKQNSFVYNLTKHALASMAKTTAIDYAHYNIRANAVCPGTIETPLYHKAIDSYCEKSGEDKAQVHLEESALQPLGRLGQPDEVAELVFFLASKNAQFITGSLQIIDGGYTTK